MRYLPLALLVGCSDPARTFVDDRTDSGTVDSARPDTTLVDTDTIADTGTIEATIDDTSADDVVSDAEVDVGPMEATITFPSATDARMIKAGSAWFNVGDFVQGSRMTALPQVSVMSGTIEIANSLGSCGADAGTVGSLDLRVSINGTMVGTVSITKDSPASVPFSVLFGAIPGPTYVIRYEEITQVAAGCGSIVIKDDVATLTLR